MAQLRVFWMPHIHPHIQGLHDVVYDAIHEPTTTQPED